MQDNGKYASKALDDGNVVLTKLLAELCGVALIKQDTVQNIVLFDVVKQISQTNPARFFRKTGLVCHLTDIYLLTNSKFFDII